MDFVSLDQKIDEAGREKIRNTHLFEADNFRSWMLYFEQGDSTPMHYHQSPETFLVIEGKCTIKGSKEKSGSLKKMRSFFFRPKTTIS
jgi:quercetin dioxygenase-like cupin family protein